jgi:hypothetical protein
VVVVCVVSVVCVCVCVCVVWCVCVCVCVVCGVCVWCVVCVCVCVWGGLLDLLPRRHSHTSVELASVIHRHTTLVFAHNLGFESLVLVCRPRRCVR